MSMQDDVPTLFSYTRWADSRILEAVRRLTPEQLVQEPAPGWSPVRSTVFHMGAVMVVWARGLRGEPYGAFPAEADHPTVDDLDRLLREGHEAFGHLIAGLDAGRMSTDWEGKDPRGTPRRLPWWVVFRHIANHATYHRGQIASKLKRLGVDPPYTDLVLWALEQAPEG